MLLKRFHDAAIELMKLERRVDPFFRPALDALCREPFATLVQALINLRRRNDGLRLAEEKPLPGEEAFLDSIIADMAAYMRRHYAPGKFQRAGNTKTHGIVRGEFVVRDDVPPEWHHGVLAEPRTFRAWVRFAGPGPASPPDIEEVGVLSIAAKLMGVPGPKLLDDERFTQDLLGVSTPTFVTPDTRSNVQLQRWSLRNASPFYFMNLHDSHVLDSIMQLLWTKTQSSPLEGDYFSCVPYLLGEGQAMQYSFATRRKRRTRVPRLPLRPPDNYLRDAMVKTLADEKVEFDVLLQVQTDPFLMPIENAGVLWPTKLSPRVPAAVLRIPKQTFDSPEQLDFARVLTYNPWHSIAEHRPLGNQSRARKRMYFELSRLRQGANAVEHYEPTGDEEFPGSAAHPSS